MRSALFASLIGLATATASFAAQPENVATEMLNSELLGWVQAPEVVAAIVAQNALHAGMTEAQIIDMDNEWRAAIGNDPTSVQVDVMGNAAATLLMAHQNQSNGLVSEIIVMDNLGMNVAATGLTSDYWQGDEAKYQKTYSMGAGSVHVGEIELDESTNAYLIQISATVTDPASGEPIGAVTYGINVGLLE